MRNVKLKSPALIGEAHYEAGQVVAVNDERAADLVGCGMAEPHEGDAVLANPDHSPLGDLIVPPPPRGTVVNPVDGLAPNVEDNPGLKKLAQLTRARARASKATPGEPGEPIGQVKPVDAETTANELTQEAGPAEDAPAESKPTEAP